MPTRAVYPSDSCTEVLSTIMHLKQVVSSKEYLSVALCTGTAARRLAALPEGLALACTGSSCQQRPLDSLNEASVLFKYTFKSNPLTYNIE